MYTVLQHVTCIVVFFVDSVRVSVLAAVDPAHVAARLRGHAAACARAAAAGPGVARALVQVAPSERARHRRRLPACSRAAAALLPILQVPRRSTRTLLAVNNTVTILQPASNDPQCNPAPTA